MIHQNEFLKTHVDALKELERLTNTNYTPMQKNSS